MFQSGRIGRAVYFGFNEKEFFFRFDYENKAPEELILAFCKPAHRRVLLELRDGKYKAHVESSTDGTHFSAMKASVKVGHGAQIEVSVPLEALGVPCEDCLIAFQVLVLQGGVELERYPERGLIEFNGPSPRFGMHNWFV